MGKNLIPQVSQMLGVELGEEFKVDMHEYTEMILKFDNNGLVARVDCEGSAWVAARVALAELLAGNIEIIKLPWKPKIYDIYWTFKAAHLDVWCVTDTHWMNNPNDVAAFKNGWVFRSKEDAEAALPLVATEIGMKYKL